MKAPLMLNLQLPRPRHYGPAVLGSVSSWLLVFFILTAQVSAQKPPDGRVMLPDLSVAEVYPRDFGALVTIVNKGARLSPPCEVTIFVYVGTGGGTLLWRESQTLKGIAPGDSAQLLFNAREREWAGMRFQVMVDSGNIVEELNETNNRTHLFDAPGKAKDRSADKSPSGSATVDLAAINVFPARDGEKSVIEGVIKNVGTESYQGSRQARVILITRKDGKNSQRTLGTVKVPVISAGAQEFITFPSPPEFDKAHDYRLTLTITVGDGNPANDTKIKSTSGFSEEDVASGADLEAAEVRKVREGGVDRMHGVVRNVSSKSYQGGREARLYFIDQTGGQKRSVLIASSTIGDVAAGGDWEIVGNVPAEFKKVKTYTLKLTISAGDSNSGNDEKTKKLVALDD